MPNLLDIRKSFYFFLSKKKKFNTKNTFICCHSNYPQLILFHNYNNISTNNNNNNKTSSLFFNCLQSQFSFQLKTIYFQISLPMINSNDQYNSWMNSYQWNKHLWNNWLNLLLLLFCLDFLNVLFYVIQLKFKQNVI